MLLAGDDDEELGFSLKGVAKSIGGGVKKVASYTPPALIAKGVMKAAPLAAKGAGGVLSIAGKGAGALIGQTIKTIAGGGAAAAGAPACTFFQRLGRFFGGSPNCE